MSVKVISFASNKMINDAYKLRKRLMESIDGAKDPIKDTQDGIINYEDNISILIKVPNKGKNFNEQNEIKYFSSIVEGLELDYPSSVSVYAEGNDLIYSLNIKSR